MWYQGIEKRRKKDSLTYDPHVFDREGYWNLNLDKVEDTVRRGRIFGPKCEKPNKLCLKKYYGKENQTYTVIIRIRKNLLEVKTAWLNRGK